MRMEAVNLKMIPSIVAAELCQLLSRSSCLTDRCRCSGRCPNGNPNKRRKKHRKQLPEKHGFDRHRSGQHLDHLVGFFLDQLRQGHAGQKHRQEEQQGLCALARAYSKRPNASWDSA